MKVIFDRYSPFNDLVVANDGLGSFDPGALDTLDCLTRLGNPIPDCRLDAFGLSWK